MFNLLIHNIIIILLFVRNFITLILFLLLIYNFISKYILKDKFKIILFDQTILFLTTLITQIWILYKKMGIEMDKLYFPKWYTNYYMNYRPYLQIILLLNLIYIIYLSLYSPDSFSYIKIIVIFYVFWDFASYFYMYISIKIFHINSYIILNQDFFDTYFCGDKAPTPTKIVWTKFIRPQNLAKGFGHINGFMVFCATCVTFIWAINELHHQAYPDEPKVVQRIAKVLDSNYQYPNDKLNNEISIKNPNHIDFSKKNYMDSNNKE